MALYPFAIHKLIPENYTQRKITPKAIIAHSAGGEAELYGWWMNDQSRGLESHFWVARDGDVYQYIDTNVRADANGEANGFAISIETQSSVHASEPWDKAQLDAIIKLMDWICKTHNIPRKLMAHKTDPGLAWHIMFGAPGPWTSAKGKVCPGPKRIEQFKNIVVPTLAKGQGSTPTPPTETPAQKEEKELMAAKDEIIAAIRAETERQKPLALRAKKSQKVWVVSAAGRWHVPDKETLNVLYFAGLIKVDKGNKPAEIEDKFIEPIPIIPRGE